MTHRNRAGALVGLCALVVGLLATSTAPAAAGGGPAAIEVTTTADVVNTEDGVVSLREAFNQANAHIGDDTILLSPEPVEGRYEVAECGEWDTYENLNAFGDFDHTDPGGSLTIDGSGNSVAATCGERAIDSHGTGRLTLRDLTVEDSGFELPGGGNGGAVRSHGDVLAEGVLLRRNHVVTGNGIGAIYSDGHLELRDSRVHHNSGSGISGRTVHLVDSVVRGNGASDGGGVFARRGVEAEGTTFKDNVASGNRGSHVCCGDGGAIFVVSGGVTLRDSTFTINHANGHGGAVSAATITMRDSTVIGGSSDHGGGGLWATGLVRLARSTIRQNRGGSIGGGVSAGSMQVIASTISGNRSQVGGGVWAEDSVSVIDSTISANTAYSGLPGDGRGGGVLVKDGSVSFLRSTVVANRASKGANVHHGSGPFVARASVIGRAIAGTNCGGAGSRTSHGFNVTDRSGSCGLTGARDRSGVAGLGLGPLADNGGPTLTHLPLDTPVSVIPLAACPTVPDQRGEPRPQGPRCEAGSVEVG